MRPWGVIAAINGLIALIFGAYAAHGLAGYANASFLVDRASEYQLVHALAIIAADRLGGEGRRWGDIAAALFTLGIIFFSGSLYLKALGAASPFLVVTPVGGMALMAGWIALGVACALRPRRGAQAQAQTTTPAG